MKVYLIGFMGSGKTHWGRLLSEKLGIRFFDLDEEYLAEMLVFAKPIAKAIERAFDCNRCGLSVIGIEVPHAHLHLIPINTANDLNFTQPKLKLTDAELEEVQTKILVNL